MRVVGIIPARYASTRFPKYYAKHYAYKDALDLMSMTALQFATSVIKLDAELTFKDQHLERKLNDLNDLLSEQS